MSNIWRFVDQPIASPTVLLDMNDGNTWKTLGGDLFTLPSPPLKRSIASSAMIDGGLLSSAAYDLRTLAFTVDLMGSTDTARIAQLDALKAQLAKPANLIMHQMQTASFPVFFRTLRSDDYVVDTEISTNFWRVTCNVLAEPFAIGVRRDLTQVTVTNDPMATGPALNSNTSFETNTVGWTGIGGTLTRTTAQFHSGVASGTITPDGVTATVRIDSANVAVTGGATYRAQGWVRCAVARSISLNINWYDASSTYITTGTGTISVAATTWTFIATDMVAPSNAAFGNIIPTMTGTPAATNILWVDEIEMRATAVNGAAFWDITGIVGDSPTPAFVRLSNLGAGNTAVLATRSVNNPTAVTVFAQAESATVGTDTTTQANDVNFSGAGTNWTRTTFATNAGFVTRATLAVPTASSAEALRGRYRVFLRCRASAAGSVFVVRWSQLDGLADVIPGPSVTYTGTTALTMLDLGALDFPVATSAPPTIGYSGLTVTYTTPSLAIQVTRTSGTASFDMDYVYLMPADERLCSVAQTQALGFIIMDGPNDTTYGMAAGTTAFGATRTVDQGGGLVSRYGGLPMLVPGVTQRWHLVVPTHTITGTKTVDVSYWPRWREVATS